VSDLSDDWEPSPVGLAPRYTGLVGSVTEVRSGRPMAVRYEGQARFPGDVHPCPSCGKLCAVPWAGAYWAECRPLLVTSADQAFALLSGGDE